MTERRRICVVTGTRAEYGLLRGLLRRLRGDAAIELQLVVTAAHLQDAFGNTVQEIEADGMPIAARVPLPLDGGTQREAAKALGRGLEAMAEALNKLRPDIVVVLGDRIELLAVASSCLILGIPLAHIHGGEITEGAIDNSVRHAVTKMAHLHFPATEIYRQRIIQLGEAPDRVINAGTLGLDNIEKAKFLSRDALAKDLGIALGAPLLLVTCHPETIADDPEASARALLEALEAFEDTTIVFTKANADPGGQAINRKVEQWVESRPNAHVFASLGAERYLSLLSHASAVIGNSSSGIIEAPALGCPDRQYRPASGRAAEAESIIDCPNDAQAITKAITRALTPAFRTGSRDTAPPYGAGGAAERIHRALATYDLSGILNKSFVDLPSARA